MLADVNETREEFSTSVFTTISETFVIIAALIAIGLNFILVVSIWKLTTFVTGLKFFFINFSVIAIVSALGCLILQVSNVIIRLFNVELATDCFCKSISLLYEVPVHVMGYQLVIIAVERLIVLFRLKRHKRIDTSGWFYCRK